MDDYEYYSCANCGNLNICSGPDYIDGSCDPDFKPKDQSENQKNVPMLISTVPMYSDNALEFKKDYYSPSLLSVHQKIDILSS